MWCRVAEQAYSLCRLILQKLNEDEDAEFDLDEDRQPVSPGLGDDGTSVEVEVEDVCDDGGDDSTHGFHSTRRSH